MSVSQARLRAPKYTPQCLPKPVVEHLNHPVAAPMIEQCSPGPAAYGLFSPFDQQSQFGSSTYRKGRTLSGKRRDIVGHAMGDDSPGPQYNIYGKNRLDNPQRGGSIGRALRFGEETRPKSVQKRPASQSRKDSDGKPPLLLATAPSALTLKDDSSRTTDDGIPPNDGADSVPTIQQGEPAGDPDVEPTHSHSEVPLRATPLSNRSVASDAQMTHPTRSSSVLSRQERSPSPLTGPKSGPVSSSERRAATPGPGAYRPDSSMKLTHPRVRGGGSFCPPQNFSRKTEQRTESRKGGPARQRWREHVKELDQRARIAASKDTFSVPVPPPVRPSVLRKIVSVTKHTPPCTFGHRPQSREEVLPGPGAYDQKLSDRFAGKRFKYLSPSGHRPLHHHDKDISADMGSYSPDFTVTRPRSVTNTVLYLTG